MSTSKRFPNDREPACAFPLDKETAQTPPVRQGELDGSGELVGGFPGPPSLRTRHQRLQRLLSIKRERAKTIKELLELRDSQLFYRVWREHVPDHEIRPLGSALAKRLAARKQTFAPRNAEGDLNLGLAFLHLAAVDPSAYVLLALGEPCDIHSFEREYWKIAGKRDSAAGILNAQARDRERRRAKAGIVKPLAIYVKDRAPSDPAIVVLRELVQQSLRTLFQDFRTTELAPKEQIALDNMLDDKPPANNAESSARQRVKKKLRAYLVAQKGTEDMNAAVANDLADLKMGQRMQGETLDEILRGVEALRARDLEVINDEEDAA
jgi:hypothetical protein